MSQTPHLAHARKVCQPAVLIGARIKVIHLTPYRTVTNQSRPSICGGFTLRALGNHAWYRHKGIRVLNVLVH